MEDPGLGSDPSHCSDNPGSLTPGTIRELLTDVLKHIMPVHLLFNTHGKIMSGKTQR